MQVLSQLLTWNFLYPLIRGEGGAYGAGCSVSREGRSSFYSYRDPNSLSTFSHFETGIQGVARGHFAQEDLDAAKLALFSKLDSTTKDRDKLVQFFLTGFSDELREKFRKDCLEVSGDEVKRVCEKYFLESLANDRSSRVVFGSPNNNMEGFVARGWKVENFVDDLSLKPMYE